MPQVMVSGGGRCFRRGGGALENEITAPVGDTPQGPHVGTARAPWPERGALRSRLVSRLQKRERSVSAVDKALGLRSFVVTSCTD